MKRVSLTAQRKKRFLEVLAQSGNVSRAARAAGVSRGAAYAKRQREPSFAKTWDEALAEALDHLEETLMARALEGTTRPVHFQGKEIGSVQSYSDQLAMFLLKARRPEVFGDKADDTVPEKEISDAKHELERKLARLAAGS